MFENILGSVVGGILSRNAAKRQAAAMDRANEMRIMPYLDMRDYLTDFYEKGTDAFKAGLDKGPYTGDTYAGMDPRTTTGLNTGYDLGSTGAADATSFMNTGRGFAQNYADLYNRSQQDMLGNATQYAADNVEPLLTAAMRDSRRDLEERQLPGLGRSAQSTGNTNSSRAGVAEAILQRGYADRESDMRSSLMDRLTDRSMRAQQSQFNNMNAANRNLANLYGDAFGLGGRAANAMTNAGRAFQLDEQARLDDERRRFEEDRDFALDYYGRYATNILKANPGGSAFGSVAANLVDPTMAGISGMMSGFGMGGNLFGGSGPVMSSTGTGYFASGGGMFGSPSGYTSFNPTPSVGVSSYY